MRGLARLLDDETRHSLNANPVLPWFVVGLFVVIGLALVLIGVGGVRNKSLRLKGGRMVEGALAQVLGGLHVLLGCLLVAIAIWDRLRP